MAHYTDEMEARCCEIDPEDDNYIELLIDQAKSFRDFGTALDTYMDEMWNELSTAEKVSWIKTRYRDAGIPSPRNIGKWFEKNAAIEKNTAILFCMAMGFELDQTEDFLRRVCLKGRLDLHDMKEIIYYFALKNGVPYRNLLPIFDALPVVDGERVPDSMQAHYTGNIRRDVDSLGSVSELSEYLHIHADMFAYDHATATRNIRHMWQRISGENGIAASERRMFEVELPEEGRSNGFDKSLSVWSIYLQMTGLYGRNIRKTSGGRTIRRILDDSHIMHAFAADCYPDRDGLEKALNGVHISSERMRKLLILLSFYEYLAGKCVATGSRIISGRDAERCRLRMNDILIDSGYPELYPGNPYDWIFLFSLENDDPLAAFREDFMRAIYYEWQAADRDGDTCRDKNKKFI